MLPASPSSPEREITLSDVIAARIIRKWNNATTTEKVVFVAAVIFIVLLTVGLFLSSPIGLGVLSGGALLAAVVGSAAPIGIPLLFFAGDEIKKTAWVYQNRNDSFVKSSILRILEGKENNPETESSEPERESSEDDFSKNTPNNTSSDYDSDPDLDATPRGDWW